LSLWLEEGTQLRDVLFTSVLMDDAQVPTGALRKKDIPFVMDKFAARLINPNVPVVIEDISDRRSISSLNIPAGYRAVTITVDRRSGVEGFARPDSRVDVLWSFVKDGRQQVATIVRFTKILSVAGMTARAEGQPAAANDQGVTTVTLLVTEKDAKKIELARTLGTVSLSLVGGEEQSAPVDDPDTVDINELIGIKPDPGKGGVEEPQADGIMYSTDPKTGKQVRYLLQNKRWVQDKNF
jgi:pilus assembly protein CpaB